MKSQVRHDIQVLENKVIELEGRMEEAAEQEDYDAAALVQTQIDDIQNEQLPLLR